MIILDTNVVSEPLKPSGSPIVRDWLDRQDSATLFLTATSLSELLVGVEFLPLGKRKEGLSVALAELLRELFEGRILPFDEAAAIRYAKLVGAGKANGHSIAVADGQIASIASVRGFTVATRDEHPFQVAGVATVNPWHG